MPVPTFDLKNYTDERYARSYCHQPWDASWGDPPKTLALALAAKGLRIIPCYFWVNEKGQQKKRPLLDDHLKQASCDPEVVAGWFNIWPRALVGLLTGESFVVLDIDAKLDAAGQLVRGVDSLPGYMDFSPLVVQTPNDGYHTYQHHDDAQAEELRKLPLSKLSTEKKIDVQWRDHYVIAAGSRLPDGRMYTFARGTYDSLDALRSLPLDRLKLLCGVGKKPRAAPQEDVEVVAVGDASARDGIARAELARLVGELSELGGSSGSNNKLNSAGYQLGAFVREGWLAREVVEEALITAWVAVGLDEREGRATLASGLRSGVRKATLPAKKAGEFTRRETGAPHGDQRNVRVALHKLGVVLSYDEFADAMWLQREGLPGLRPTRDRLSTVACCDLRLELEERFRLLAPRQDFEDILHRAARKNSYHPVRDYLDDLKWDGAPRVETWLTTYGRAADSPLTRAVGKSFLVAAVRRIRHPGCKFDELLVLEGAQGVGKSSALAALVPDTTWFTDSFSLHSDDRKLIEQTRGKWLVEVAELSGMRRSETEKLKATLSRQVDVARLVYEREPTSRPRDFVFAGTTNEDDYLKDATGNRRFWPVQVEELDVVGLARDRNQLWAEACEAESRGDLTSLPRELWKNLAVAQEARLAGDPWEHELTRVLKDITGKLANHDVWRALSVHMERRTADQNSRLGKAMRRLGFIRTKQNIDKVTVACWARGKPDERQRRIFLNFDPARGWFADHVKVEVEAEDVNQLDLPDAY